MLDKLEAIKARFDDLGVALTNPAIIGDNKKFGTLSKEYRSLEKIVVAYTRYKKLIDDIDFYREALNGTDEEMRELAKIELPETEEQKEKMESGIRQMLIPKDPQDEKNAILEIRAGTGGDEASLFAGDLVRMYMRYCEQRGWKTALLSENEGTVGGYKEVQIEVVGDEVYGTLKFESGVHRVPVNRGWTPYGWTNSRMSDCSPCWYFSAVAPFIPHPYTRCIQRLFFQLFMV